MASVGFAGALGADALSQEIRQQIMDKLMQQQVQHGMSVEDQRLALEKQRIEQDAADRALLRQQQGQAFNESLAEKTAGNLTPQSIVSPELAQRFTNTSLAPLISADKTLPSTSMATAAPMVGAETPDVQPTVTQTPSILTGQLRYAGTPKQVDSDAQKAILGQLINAASPREKMALQYEQATGKNPPAGVFDKQASAEPLEQVLTPQGPKYLPRSQAVGQTPYHVPAAPATVTIQTVDAQGKPVERVLTKEQALKEGTFGAKPGQTMESRLASAKAVVQTGDDMIAQLSDPTLAAQLGPAMSRYNNIADFVGNPPPEFAKLAGEIESYSLANMGVHGMRSASGAEAIKATLGQGRHTPGTIIAVINGLNSFANHLMTNEGGNTAPAKLSAEELIKKYGR